MMDTRMEIVSIQYAHIAYWASIAVVAELEKSRRAVKKHAQTHATSRTLCKANEVGRFWEYRELHLVYLYVYL